MKTDNFEIELKSEDVFDITMRESAGSSSTSNYNNLINKPCIEGEELVGNKTFEDLHMNALTNRELEALLQ